MREQNINENILSLISVLNSEGQIASKATALQKTDWPVIIDAIRHRGLSGYFYNLLSKNDAFSEVPSTIFDTLKNSARRIAAHNVFYESQCAKILHGIYAAGGEAILLKGFSYMQELYGDTFSRSMSDIDLLIRPDDRMKVLEHLLAEGFSVYIIPSFKGSPDDFVTLTDIIGETHFVKNSSALTISIDLHWKMRAEYPMNNYLNLDKLPWWQNTNTVTIGGVQVTRLSPEMQFIHLALHFSIHHHYTGLRWFVELFLFLKMFGNKLDWVFIHDTASSPDCRKVLGVCLRLINDYMGESCPAVKQWKRFLSGIRLLPGEYCFYKSCLLRDKKSRFAEYLCMPLSPATITGRLKMIYYFFFDEQGVILWHGSDKQVPKWLLPFYNLYIICRQLLRRKELSNN